MDAFFCVRHAEKEDNDPYDPELSTTGEARAEHLGRIMAEAGLDLVFASGARRVQQTAEPVQRRAHTAASLKCMKPENQEEWLLNLLLKAGKK
ncbi:MAG: histidine phosphatase family protein [Lewinellaceae bacterium]|nr:histidine phosphatase family protein [Lewinellaceae bacterium]